MRRLPRSITALVLYLFVIFNIERVTLQNIGVVDIKGFVYLLVALFVLVIIRIDRIRDQSIGVLLFLATTVYFIGKFSVFYYYTQWNENTIYLIITELAVLWIGIWLAKMAGNAVKDFSEAVESITFSSLEKTKTLEEADRDIQAELYRSRRYNYPLTLVVVQPETDPLEYVPQIAIQEMQRSLLSRYAAVSLARELGKELRLLDTIIDLKHNMRFAILFPQTDGGKADFLIDRIYKIATDLGVGVTCGHASFPSDALTFEELLYTASDHMRYPTNSKPPEEFTNSEIPEKTSTDNNNDGEE